MVHQILLNLIGNAIKFTDEGIVEVSAKAENGYVAVTVSDTGIGMTADTLDHIFKPFEQADGSIARLYGGTGLGLAITQQLIELMNGKITVESTPGKGSCFSIDLPQNNPSQNIQTPEAGNSKD